MAEPKVEMPTISQPELDRLTKLDAKDKKSRRKSRFGEMKKRMIVAKAVAAGITVTDAEVNKRLDALDSKKA